MGQQPKPRRTSHLWRVVIALGLGLVTTVGFAGYGWRAVGDALAMWRVPSFRWSRGFDDGRDGRTWYWEQFEGRTSEYREVLEISRAGVDSILQSGLWRDEHGTVHGVPSPWADVSQSIEAMRSNEVTFEEFRFGFPRRCLRMAAAFDDGVPPPRVRMLAGCRTRSAGRFFDWQDCAPTSPIWSGLLADTAIFGVAWLMVLEIGPARRWIRARRRAARGLCLGCAYHRAGLSPTAPCPECGMIPNPS